MVWCGALSGDNGERKEVTWKENEKDQKKKKRER
jgi:hypothetical protein